MNALSIVASGTSTNVSDSSFFTVLFLVSARDGGRADKCAFGVKVSRS